MTIRDANYIAQTFAFQMVNRKLVFVYFVRKGLELKVFGIRRLHHETCKRSLQARKPIVIMN